MEKLYLDNFEAKSKIKSMFAQVFFVMAWLVIFWGYRNGG